jgi:hypothetical protein
MMILVAVMAGIIWGFGLWWNAVFYRGLARSQAAWARMIIVDIRNDSGSRIVRDDELARMNREWVAYHAAQRDKYTYAASHPWVSVEVSPPHPFPMSGPGRILTVEYQ